MLFCEYFFENQPGKVDLFVTICVRNGDKLSTFRAVTDMSQQRCQ